MWLPCFLFDPHSPMKAKFSRTREREWEKAFKGNLAFSTFSSVFLELLFHGVEGWIMRSQEESPKATKEEKQLLALFL
jgi:hypothetical protein